ncbi:MAG: hypothetical protein EA001_03505 [Oscillatoriales cyanobacterium]|nr:MAG: hypothetical protein EA001_03505 [Oscillatoriales cyanobacterium]
MYPCSQSWHRSTWLQSALIRWSSALAPLLGALLVLGSAGAAGADPFRSQNPRPIGDRAEAAFVNLFQGGNYPAARRLAQESIEREPQEPLGHALMGALSYLEGQWAQVQTSAAQTLKAAEALKASDPLRGNLYLGVGHFLEGAFIISEGGQGTLQGAPEALGKLSQVNAALDAALAIDPNDPELNLVRGSLDVLLADNLPFGNMNTAMASLQKGKPDYVVARMMAAVYRRQKQFDRALASVDRALVSGANNPDLLHLKGQILYEQGHRSQNLSLLKQSEALFLQVLALRDQLPRSVVRHLEKNELRRVQRDIRNLATP